MTARQRTSTNQELVEQVKQEMINENLQYSGRHDKKKYPSYPLRGKKITPEFGMLLSKMIAPDPEPEPKRRYGDVVHRNTEFLKIKLNKETRIRL